jgi:hypothetical protein
MGRRGEGQDEREGHGSHASVRPWKRGAGKVLAPARRGLAVDADAADPLATESVALAGLASAAVQGRLALGPQAGARVERLGGDPDAPWVESARPLQARCGGCDLHAGVTGGPFEAPVPAEGENSGECLR